MKLVKIGDHLKFETSMGAMTMAEVVNFLSTSTGKSISALEYDLGMTNGPLRKIVRGEGRPSTQLATLLEAMMLLGYEVNITKKSA